MNFLSSNFLSSIRHFFVGETVITIENVEGLKQFLTQYYEKFSSYTQPGEIIELLKLKRAVGAYYPFHIIIRGRINKKLEMVHQKGSKYCVS